MCRLPGTLQRTLSVSPGRGVGTHWPDGHPCASIHDHFIIYNEVIGIPRANQPCWPPSQPCTVPHQKRAVGLRPVKPLHGNQAALERKPPTLSTTGEIHADSVLAGLWKRACLTLTGNCTSAQLQGLSECVLSWEARCPHGWNPTARLPDADKSAIPLPPRLPPSHLPLYGRHLLMPLR